MALDLRNALTALRETSGSRRIAILGAAAAAIVAIWLLTRWATAPAYVTLYADLDPAQTGAITERLGKLDISYQLDDRGTEVRVPARDLARARVALAKDNLPLNGRPGLELFDRPSWGMTDFTQRVTFQRALEGELGRALGEIRGIKRAEVHLVLPQASPLRRLERPAEASVMLTLEPGVTLSPETVRGITHLVSNSVEQLSPDHVAVLDHLGRLLSAPTGDDGLAGVTNRQLELQRSVEEHLARKVERLLGTVLGAGRARVQVAADLDFAQVDRTTEQYDPDGQVLQSEQRSEVTTPVSADTVAGTATGGETIINNAYQNSRRVERVVGAVGGIRRLTVAVVLDEAITRRDATGSGVDSTQLAQVTAVVRDAIGIDIARGDRVSVVALPFGAISLPDSASKPEGGLLADPMALLDRLALPLLALIAIAAVALVAWRSLSSDRPAAVAVSRAPNEPPTGNAALPAGPAAMPLPALATAAANSELQTLRQHAVAATSDRPEHAAQVIRAWIAEQ